MNYYMARGCVRAGQNDCAIQYLRMALNEGFTNPKKIEADSEFAVLRGVPAFEQLLAAQGTPDQILAWHPWRRDPGLVVHPGLPSVYLHVGWLVAHLSYPVGVAMNIRLMSAFFFCFAFALAAVAAGQPVSQSASPPPAGQAAVQSGGQQAPAQGSNAGRWQGQRGGRGMGGGYGMGRDAA